MVAPPLTERVYFHPPAPSATDSWWSRYANQLQGLSATARAAVEADSSLIDLGETRMFWDDDDDGLIGLARQNADDLQALVTREPDGRVQGHGRGGLLAVFDM